MDADMLVVGKVGWGDNTHDSKLTADEQYAHITLWAMLSSPLLIGCDIAAMDDFTLSLLTNSEVIDVNQDPLGIPATRFFWDDKYATYVKPLEDGSVAVAMFNFDEAPQKIGFVARSFGLTETVTVRDLWRQQDIQQLAAGERYDVEVAPHGAALYKLYPGNPEGRRVGDWRGSSSSYPKSIQSK
jgi:alpha-galactosidase